MERHLIAAGGDVLLDDDLRRRIAARGVSELYGDHRLRR